MVKIRNDGEWKRGNYKASHSELKKMPVVSDCVKEQWLCYMANSSIHGLPDILKAKNRYSKAGWLLLLWSCVAGLLVHIVFKTEVYHAEPFGTKSRFSTATSMPSVLFCPQDWFDPVKVAKYDVSVELQDYIVSLFSLGPYTEYFDTEDLLKDDVTIGRLQAELNRLLEKWDMDIDDLLEDISHEHDAFIQKAHLIPLVGGSKNTNITKIINAVGVCYLIESVKVIPALVLQHGGLQFEIKTEESKRNRTDLLHVTQSNTFGRIIVGDTAKHLLPEGQFLLEEGYRYSLRASRITFLQDPSGSSICVPGTEDEAHSAMREASRCYMEEYNKLCSQSCITMIPRLRASGISGKRKYKPLGNFCSYLSGSDSCLKKGLNHPDISSIPCYMPCHQDIYYVNMQQVSSKDMHMNIFVQLDNPLHSVEVTEFVRNTFTDYAADLGGIVALWFGASILSAAQLLHYGMGCIATIYEHWKNKKQGASHERRRSSDRSRIFSLDIAPIC